MCVDGAVMLISKTVGRWRQRGQAMVEYMAAASVLWLALFVAEYDGRTAAQYLADAVRAFFRNLTHYLTLP